MEREAEGVGENMATEFNKFNATAIKSELAIILGQVDSIAGVHQIDFVVGATPDMPWGDVFAPPTPGGDKPFVLPPPPTPRPEAPEFQFGTPYVPSTGWAYLHEGEAVLTKEENRHREERGTRVTVVNNFGRDSVRSDEDIRSIIDSIQTSLELQGVRGRIA
jgi:hypothetical protein